MFWEGSDEGINEGGKVNDRKKGQNMVLVELAGWGIKTARKFKKLLEDYEQTPSSKVLLASMIKFEEMYQPLYRGVFRPDPFGEIRGENEYRAAKRAGVSLRQKDLVRVTGGGSGKRLILTTRAHRIFYREYPLAKLRKQKWDGLWTLVTYDLPNRLRNRRNFLRKKLKELGFGCPQESLYVSPLPLARPLKDLVDGENLADYVWVTVARRVLGLDNREVAQRAWKLGEINDLYGQLLRVLPRVKKVGDKQLLAEWQKYFLAVDLADPYLPRELLPENWVGERCRRQFSRLGLWGLLKSLFGLL